MGGAYGIASFGEVLKGGVKMPWYPSLLNHQNNIKTEIRPTHLPCGSVEKTLFLDQLESRLFAEVEVECGDKRVGLAYWWNTSWYVNV